MILRIDPTSETAVYRQIVDGLRIALVGGELAPGDALPSVRRLALDLGVNFNTVAQAYRALAKEGWLEIEFSCNWLTAPLESKAKAPETISCVGAMTCRETAQYPKLLADSKMACQLKGSLWLKLATSAQPTSSSKK